MLDSLAALTGCRFPSDVERLRRVSARILERIHVERIIHRSAPRQKSHRAASGLCFSRFVAHCDPWNVDNPHENCARCWYQTPISPSAKANNADALTGGTVIDGHIATVTPSLLLAVIPQNVVTSAEYVVVSMG